MKRPNGLRIAGGFAVGLLSFAAVFTATFFLTAFVYRSIGLHPPAYLSQMITSLLGLVFGGLIVSAVSARFLPRVRAQQAGFVRPIIEAMDRISRGDFDVRLDDDFPGREAELLGDVVKSVNKMALELGRLEQMRQEFISDVSHEIQSPLTSIRGFAQALHDDGLLPEERHHFLTIIETESTRLSRLTDNLLRLASLDAEQVKFAPKPYRLDRQIRDLILAAEPQWSGKGIDLDVSLADVTITADEDLLSQVWINLIHNGIKFTPDGGSIRISLQRRDGVIEFCIADTGIGIPEEDQARIFERFYKVDRSRERSREGSGLGLSIARKIIELHRGTIRLESKVGSGTTFIVTLPRKSQPAQPADR